MPHVVRKEANRPAAKLNNKSPRTALCHSTIINSDSTTVINYSIDESSERRFFGILEKIKYET